MDEKTARSIAERLYGDSLDAAGYPAIGHPRRVAAVVSVVSRPVAWLHDVVEDGMISLPELELEGLTCPQYGALLLLTRRSGSKSVRTYQDYVRTIADYGWTLAGQIAGDVKLADLADNMTRPCPPSLSTLRSMGGRYDRARETLNRGRLQDEPPSEKPDLPGRQQRQPLLRREGEQWDFAEKERWFG